MKLELNTHRSILLQILKDIYSDTTIGPVLGFKGGTAVYLFYNLNRFSVDLDFDLLDIAKIDYVYSRIGEIVKNYGLVKQSAKKRYTLFFLISYGAEAKNIKIEINLRDFGSKYEVKSFLGVAMKVMIKPDLFANKIVAMFERIGKANRDIFEVHFFLKNNWSLNQELVEKCVQIKFKDFLEKCIVELEKISNRHILSGIGELIDAKQKAWVKNNLLSDTVFLLKIKLSEKV